MYLTDFTLHLQYNTPNKILNLTLLVVNYDKSRQFTQVSEFVKVAAWQKVEWPSTCRGREGVCHLSCFVAFVSLIFPFVTGMDGRAKGRFLQEKTRRTSCTI